MLSKILESLGAALFLAFALVVWPPLALLVLGALLIFAGYLTADVEISLRRPGKGKAE